MLEVNHLSLQLIDLEGRRQARSRVRGDAELPGAFSSKGTPEPHTAPVTDSGQHPWSRAVHNTLSSPMLVVVSAAAHVAPSQPVFLQVKPTQTLLWWNWKWRGAKEPRTELGLPDPSCGVSRMPSCLQSLLLCCDGGGGWQAPSYMFKKASNE